MPRVTAAILIVLTVVVSALPAHAATVTKPYFGAYEANVVLGGGGQLEGEISVLYPTNHVSLEFSCAKPMGADSISAEMSTPPIPLRNGTFRFDATVKLTRFLTVRANNLILKQSFYRASVDISGTFVAKRDQFSGTASLGGTPCGATAYTAVRKAAPAPEGRLVRR